jgi:hypothetical protein
VIVVVLEKLCSIGIERKVAVIVVVLEKLCSIGIERKVAFGIRGYYKDWWLVVYDVFCLWSLKRMMDENFKSLTRKEVTSNVQVLFSSSSTTVKPRSQKVG